MSGPPSFSRRNAAQAAGLTPHGWHGATGTLGIMISGCLNANRAAIYASKRKEGKMLKQFAATVACASMLVLLVGVFHYEPPVGSNIEKAQQPRYKCPKGQRFQGGQCVKW